MAQKLTVRSKTVCFEISGCEFSRVSMKLTAATFGMLIYKGARSVYCTIGDAATADYKCQEWKLDTCT